MSAITICDKDIADTVTLKGGSKPKDDGRMKIDEAEKVQEDIRIELKELDQNVLEGNVTRRGECTSTNVGKWKRKERRIQVQNTKEHEQKENVVVNGNKRILQ